MACHDKDTEDRVKRLAEEVRRDAKIDVMMHLVVAIAYELRDAPLKDREDELSRVVAAIRRAWAKEH